MIAENLDELLGNLDGVQQPRQAEEQVHFFVSLRQLKAELLERRAGGASGFLIRGDQTAALGRIASGMCRFLVQISFRAAPVRQRPHPGPSLPAGCEPGRPIKSSTLFTRLRGLNGLASTQRKSRPPRRRLHAMAALST